MLQTRIPYGVSCPGPGAAGRRRGLRGRAHSYHDPHGLRRAPSGRGSSARWLNSSTFLVKIWPFHSSWTPSVGDLHQLVLPDLFARMVAWCGEPEFDTQDRDRPAAEHHRAVIRPAAAAGVAAAGRRGRRRRLHHDIRIPRRDETDPSAPRRRTATASPGGPAGLAAAAAPAAASLRMPRRLFARLGRLPLLAELDAGEAIAATSIDSRG